MELPLTKMGEAVDGMVLFGRQEKELSNQKFSFRHNFDIFISCPREDVKQRTGYMELKLRENVQSEITNMYVSKMQTFPM